LLTHSLEGVRLPFTSAKYSGCASNAARLAAMIDPYACPLFRAKPFTARLRAHHSRYGRSLYPHRVPQLYQMRRAWKSGDSSASTATDSRSSFGTTSHVVPGKNCR